MVCAIAVQRLSDNPPIRKKPTRIQLFSDQESRWRPGIFCGTLSAYLPLKRCVMPSLNLIQHHPAEGPGAIALWAESRGLTLNVFRADLGQLPPVSAAPVILLGGPYEANAGPAWLETERQWLAASLDQGAAVFAICLGAQLLALSLGGNVRRMDRMETGWTPVTFVDGQTLKVLEWHEDAIDLPPNAQLLASSSSANSRCTAPGRLGWACSFIRSGTPNRWPC